MSRLLFETNDGQQHDISLGIIKSTEISDDDVFVLKFEVSNSASAADAQYALENIRNIFKAYFPKNRVLVIPMRNGKEDLEIELIKETQE